MLTSLDDLLAVVTAVYRSGDTPKELRLLSAPSKVAAGVSVQELAREIRTTPKRIEGIIRAADPAAEVLKTTLAEAADETKMRKARQSLGQMLLGTLCEHAFEDLYREAMQTTELRLEDTREGGTDTDYRVFNGSHRPVFRINIKFHGSPFRRAKELVGLEPEDCFALATYKIYGAIEKLQKERLPYVFVILGVPGLRGETVGSALPSTLAHFASLILCGSIPGKRRIEDQIVQHLVADPQPADVRQTVEGFTQQIRGASWRVLGARRAEKLVRELLFDRVYALRVRAFTSHYRRAEVDMHFSISNDLTPLDDFLHLLRDHGLQGLTTRLEGGDI